MKVKTITFFMLFLASLPMKTLASLNVFRVEDKTDIELKGDTEDDRQKSLVFPFEAYKIDNAEVCVDSDDTYSTVIIRIVNAVGETIDIYSSTLIQQQKVSFNISGYPNGIYTLVITTPKGTYLTGVFEINR